MLETLAYIGGALVLVVYVSGLVIWTSIFLGEDHEWKDLPLLFAGLVWPYFIYLRIRELRAK